jgi:hypothetical protein
VTSGRSRDCVSPTGSVNRPRNWIGNRATWSTPHGESLAAGKFVPGLDVEPGVDRTIRVLLVSGSLRSRSTNTAALRTAAALVVPGVEGVLYEDVSSLPHFNPDDDSDPLPGAVADLRSPIRTAEPLLGSGTGQLLAAASGHHWTVVDMAADWLTVFPSPG